MNVNKILFILLFCILVSCINNKVFAKYYIEYTQIIGETNIDRTPPVTTFDEKIIEDGKVQGTIISNEKVKSLDGWELSEDQKVLTKIFTSNISYVLQIEDLAGNKVNVNINITQATNITLTFASHNSNTGWSYGYGNYDIAGLEAVKKNPMYKTEALAFNVTGNVSSDFVQARTFAYTHWGVGSTGVCVDSGLKYSYGYSTWKSMVSNDLVTLKSQKYFQFRWCWNKQRWKN